MLSTLMVLIAFTLTIFVHEFGHYIMAKRAGVKVLTFSIGIGPKIMTLYTEKSGTQWVLSLLPIGGFVQLKGQSDNPFDLTKDNKDPDDYRVKSPMNRLSIILAGVVMNTVFAYILLVFAYNLGVPFIKNTVGDVKPSSLAEKKGFQKNDIITNINGEKIESWEDYSTYINTSTSSKLNITINRNQQKKIISINAKDIKTLKGSIPLKEIGLSPQRRAVIEKFNPSFSQKQLKKLKLEKKQIITSAQLENSSIIRESAFGISYLIQTNPDKNITLTLQNKDHTITKTRVKIPYQEHPDIYSIQTTSIITPIPDYPAIIAGIHNGDKITGINNTSIRGWRDVYTYLSKQKTNKSLLIKVNRDKKILSFDVTPKYNSDEERFIIGIKPQDSFASKTISYVPSIFKNLINPPRVDDILLKTKTTKKGIIFYLKRNSSNINSFIPLKKFPKYRVGHLFDMSIEEKIVKYSFFQSIKHSFERTYYEIKNSFSFLASVIEGRLSPKLIGGPIKIFQVSHFIAKNKTLSYFLLLFAKIGFSLAIVNLLPIPILDGGHAFFIIIEMIRGKPLKEKTAMLFQQVGLFLMLSLTVFVFYNDISSLLR